MSQRAPRRGRVRGATRLLKTVEIGRATGRIIGAGRRAASAIDHLPDSVRERVREMLSDTRIPYLDIADYILTETCPKRLRSRAEEGLRVVHAQVESVRGKDGAHRAERAREDLTKKLWRELCDACVKGEETPRLISDDSLCREYTEQVRSVAQVESTVRMIQEMTGSEAGPAQAILIGSAWASHVVNTTYKHARAVRTEKEWKGHMRVVRDMSMLLRTMVEIERMRRDDERRVAEVHEAYLDRLRVEFKAEPDLQKRIAAIMERARAALTDSQADAREAA